MSSDKSLLEDVRSLSMQLNRQAYARPPIEGWLSSFLAMLYERLASLKVTGIQVAQVIGNVAVEMASAGTVPHHAVNQYALDDSSLVAVALNTRQLAVAPDSRIYPILIGEDAVAVMILYTTEASVEVDDAISTLMLQLGPAIMQNFRTVGPQTGRLTRQIDMMRSLYEATKTVSSILESTEVLARAAHSLVETLKVDHAGIVVYDYTQNIGTVVAEYPDNKSIGQKLQIRGTPVQERLLVEKKPIIIEDIEAATELGANRDTLLEFGLKSVAIFPMLAEGQLIGSVGIDSFKEKRSFTPEEIEGALAITDQLAVSVRNAQLYDEIRRRATQLESIADLSRRVTSTFNQHEIFEIIKEETQNLIEAELISVALKPSEGPSLLVYMLDETEPAPLEFLAQDTALRLVLTNIGPVVLDDISGSDYPDYKAFASYGMHAAVIVPLVAGGHALGTFNVLHSQPGRYSSIDLAMLEQVGNQLAIALENARLFAQAAQRADVERLMNRLSSGIQGKGDMHSILLASVQQMAEALQANRARIRLQMDTAQRLDQEHKTDRIITDRIIAKLQEKAQKSEK
jgi:GAF domain-containing protein